MIAFVRPAAADRIHSAIKADDTTEVISQAARARSPSTISSTRAFDLSKSVELILRLIDSKAKRFADQLQSASRAGAVRVHGVDSRFVLADRKLWCLESESVPIVLRPLRLMDIRTILFGDGGGSELIIDEELDFDARMRMRSIDGPSGYPIAIGIV